MTPTNCSAASAPKAGRRGCGTSPASSVWENSAAALCAAIHAHTRRKSTARGAPSGEPQGGGAYLRLDNTVWRYIAVAGLMLLISLPFLAAGAIVAAEAAARAIQVRVLNRALGEFCVATRLGACVVPYSAVPFNFESCIRG